jgi:hypothetical protein
VGWTPAAEQKNYAQISHYHALLALAEELKLPLVQIVNIAGLAQTSFSPESLEAIELTAQSALTLVEGLLLSLRLYTTEQPQLQPVSLGAVLQDTAQALSGFARQQNCSLEVHIDGRASLVMADPSILRAALASLGLMFIEASGQQEEAPAVMLAAHRSRWGMVTGLYSEQQGLSTELYRRGRNIIGRVAQPFSQFVANNGAGAIIADALLQNMSSHLHVSHHRKQAGLAATLLPSQQLNLI